MSSTQAAALVDRHLAGLLADLARQPDEEAIGALHAAVSRLQAALLDRLGSFEEYGGPQAAGCKTLKAWTRLHLRHTPATAGRTAASITALRQLDQVAAAFTAGRIGADHVAAFATGVDQVGADAMRTHEATLVELARAASARELRTAIEALADAVDPDRDAKAVQALAKRSFTGARVGDLYAFRGAVDPSCGEALASWIAAHSAPANTADGEKDPRTATQRRADAFGQLVDTAAGSGALPERVRSTAAVIMTISIETLLGLPGAGPLLERLGRIPCPTAERLLCEGTLTRVILDAAGHPIDVGRTQRSHTTAQATALAALYQTCIWPGCGICFRECDIHHLVAWIDGGPTDLANLRPVCKSHHRWLHEGGYRIRTHDDDALTFHDAAGNQIPNPDDTLNATLNQLVLEINDQHLNGTGLRTDIPAWKPYVRRHATLPDDPDPPPRRE